MGIMRFITGIHYSKSMLRTLNGLTFLFDPNWEASKSELPTFPVVFFHVKSHHEVHEAEVSQKQMLFYNSQKAVAKDTTTGSILNVVADNIVIKPKQYRLDIILPYDCLSMFEKNYTLNADQNSAIFSVLTSGEKESKQNVLSIPMLVSNNPIVQVLLSMFRTLTMTSDMSSFQNWLTSATAVPDHNKRSLEQMFRNRTVLKFKTWTGWNYKYVMITSMDISKEPDEEGVYQASLTLQEVPILTVRSDAGINKENKMRYNSALEGAGLVVKKVLNGKEL